MALMPYNAETPKRIPLHYTLWSMIWKKMTRKPIKHIAVVTLQNGTLMEY